jgi:hypothetical protein
MSTQKIELRNLCKSTLNRSIEWLSDPVEQRKSWEGSTNHIALIDMTLEFFFNFSSFLLEDSLFAEYPDSPIFFLIKELREAIKNIYLADKIVKEMEMETFLNEPLWIKIQTTSQQTKAELEKIIKKGKLV